MDFMPREPRLPRGRRWPRRTGPVLEALVELSEQAVEEVPNHGRGTRVEINPVDQSRVEGRRQRDLSSRSLNVRGVWDRAVDAWMNDDVDGLDAVWDEIIVNLGSDYDAYSNVWAA